MVVFIPAEVEYAVNKIIRELLKKETGIDFIIHSYDDMITRIDDKTVNTILRLVDINRDYIVSNTNDPYTATVYLHVISNILPQARRLINEYKDELIRKLRDYFSYMDTGTRPEPDMTELMDISLTYFGVMGVYKGKNGLFVLPSKDDLDGISNSIDTNYMLERSIIILSQRVLGPLSIVNGSLYAGQEKIVDIRNGERFLVNISNKTSLLKYHIDNLTQLVLPHLFDSLERLLKRYGGTDVSIRKGILGVIIECPLKCFAEVYNLPELPDSIGSLRVPVDVFVGISGKTVMLHGEVYIKGISNIVFGDLSFEYTQQYDVGINIDDFMKEFSSRLIKILSLYAGVSEVIRHTVSRYGLKYVLRDDKVILTKTSKHGKLTITVSRDNEKISVSAKITANKWMSENKLKRYIKSNGLELPKIEWKGNPTLYLGDTVVSSGDELRSLIERSIKYFDIIREYHEKLIHKRSKEETISLYLLLSLTPQYFKDEVKQVLNDTNKLLSRFSSIDVTRNYQLLLNSDKVILSLVSEGIVKIEDNQVKVFERRLYSILRDLDFSESNSIRIEKEIAERIPKLVLRFKLDDIIKNDTTRKLWLSLPEDLKKKYVENLSSMELMKIIDNPPYRNLFPFNYVLSTALKSSNPNIKTHVVFNYYKHLLGSKVLVKERKVESLVVLDVDKFYIQVWDVKRDEIDLIIYGKNKKIGVLYSGRDLVNALIKAIRTYDSVIDILSKDVGTVKSKISSSFSILLDADRRVPVRGDKTKVFEDSEVHVG